MSSHKFGGRTLARSQALQLLFQAEATGRSVEAVLAGPYALSQGPLDEFGEQLALGADGMRQELDTIIEGASTNWSVGRMPSVDRNLLRLALYEMLEVNEVAVPVTIDESVELAKAFGTDESSRFVNGLLGRVATELEQGVDLLGAAKESCAAAVYDVVDESDGLSVVADEADASTALPDSSVVNEVAPDACDVTSELGEVEE